jgi:hypothetical protein
MQNIEQVIPEQALQLRKKPRGNPAWVKGHNQAGPGRPFLGGFRR